MPSINKRPISRTNDPGVVAWLESLSKAALADIFIDMTQRNLGDENADGETLLAAMVEEAEPVMRVRGDKLPPTDQWQKDRCKRVASLRAGVLDIPRATPEERAAARANVRRRANDLLAEGRALRPSFPWPDDQ